MTTISFKIEDDDLADVREYEDEHELDNRSEAIRELLERGLAYEDLQDELDATEARLEDLRRQLAEVRSHEDDVQELVEYVEQERDVQLQERAERRAWRRAGLVSKAKWTVLGMPDDLASDRDDARE